MRPPDKTKAAGLAIQPPEKKHPSKNFRRAPSAAQVEASMRYYASMLGKPGKGQP